MLANIIGGFILILVGVSLTGTIAQMTNEASAVNGSLYNSSVWGANVLSMTPGFFALSLLGIGIAVCYSTLVQAGIV